MIQFDEYFLDGLKPPTRKRMVPYRKDDTISSTTLCYTYVWSGMMLSLGCGYGMMNGMFFGIERWFQKQMASYRWLM